MFLILVTGAAAIIAAIDLGLLDRLEGLFLLVVFLTIVVLLGVILLRDGRRYVEFRHKAIMLAFPLPLHVRRIPAESIANVRFQFTERDRRFYETIDDQVPLIPHHYELVLDLFGRVPPQVLKDRQFQGGISHLLPYVAHLYRSMEKYERTEVFLDDPHRLFGTDSNAPFSDYFYGKLTQATADLDKLTSWLTSCTWKSQDPNRHEWLHPPEFEKQRKGDDKDHALWAWRALVERGFEAQLVSGRQFTDRYGWQDYTWVSFYDGSRQLYFLEASLKDSDSLIVPERIARERLVPHVDIDRRQKTFQHPINILTDPRVPKGEVEPRRPPSPDVEPRR